MLYGNANHGSGTKVKGVTQIPARPVGARQATLRTINLSTVARAVFAAPGSLTRADIAGASGLTRSTVSRLVDQLVAGGILGEGDPARPQGRGRPGVPLGPAEGTFVSIGLEANVGYLAATAIDLTGTVLAHRMVQEDLAASDPDATLHRLAALGKEVLRQAPNRLLGVRVALPGIVDRGAGILLRAPNLRWREVDVRATLAGLAPEGSVVGVANEADCAAMTIAHRLPGSLDPDLESFMYVSGNVGIGSATVTAGRMFGGDHGWAGELGHVCVDPDGPACGCGARGCLEAIIGRSALLRSSGHDTWEALLAAAGTPGPRLESTLERAGRALGVALSGALNLLDLSEVVLGGHLAALAPALLPTVTDELDRRVLAAPFAPVCVRTRTTRDAAGALGAAYLGVLDMLDDPATILDRAQAPAPDTRT